MSGYFDIDVYSHHFTLTCVQVRGREVIESFASRYVQKGWVKVGRKFELQPVRVYGTKLKDNSEFRFHIHQYELFLKHLANNQIPASTYLVRVHEAETGDPVGLKLLEGWKPLERQVPIIAYLNSEQPSRRKMVEVQPGFGKSFMATSAAVTLGVRVAFVLKPMFIEKWTSDLAKMCGLKGDDVVAVQGSDSLMAVIAQAKQGLLKEKAILFSSRTLQAWYKLYSEHGAGILDMGYDCLPQDLFPTLGIGLRIIDEVHMDFHLMFKVDLFTHVKWSISLSATLISDDPFTQRMYELTYPQNERYNGVLYNKYVYAYSWIYSFDQPNKIRTKSFGSNTYSHHEFEKSVIRNKNILDGYLDMLYACVKRYYLDNDHKPGDRLLVYCTSINMATLMTEHLKALMPNQDVRRYVEDDPYENLMQADVSVSTLLSAGTGHDIAGLTTVIMTTAIKSSASNIQGFGRIREISGRKLKFVYWACQDVPKHLDYHEGKRELLKSKALDYDTYHYPIFVG